MRRRYRARVAALQLQAPSYTPSPQGQGFMAATSRKAAGKVTVPPARLTRMTPSSSGWRNASSAATGNSPSSSRNRMPWVARLTSPGRSDQLPAADQGDDGGLVVRRAEGRALEQRAVGQGATGGRVDAGHRERLRRR